MLGFSVLSSVFVLAFFGWFSISWGIVVWVFLLVWGGFVLFFFLDEGCGCSLTMQ